MLKPKTYNIADSNIANLGSDLEKSVREAAANTEPAWEKAGTVVGTEIWRIEKFQVKSIAKETYGKFFSGDSYIVLHTYKEKDSDALKWDVHFWLGSHTTQDEAGTAAYKTVELDDKLGGAPVQHREVQGYESRLFLSYFKNPIRILEGGIESGFNHVEPESYEPRLLQMKGKRRIRVSQVNLTCDSLNSGDVFILDLGLNLYQWNGTKSSGMERNKAGQLARAIDDERKGLAEVHVFEEGDSDIPGVFWETLGGKGDIKSADEGGDDEADAGQHDKKLLQLSDASGSMEFNEVASGTVTKDALDSNDVFIFDVGNEVFCWIGSGASVEEKSKSMSYAEQYLNIAGRPNYLPISRVLEGGENEVFEAAFD